MERTTIDLWFGAFVAAGFAALLVLALKVGNLGAERATQTYRVEVRFDNMASRLWLWVDIIWIKSRPLGLGARRYLDAMRHCFEREPPRS